LFKTGCCKQFYMDTSQKYEELQKAIEFLRQTLNESKMNLDYSVDSVKHLDWLLSDAFKNGKVKNPNGTFAKYQGIIMFGITGYLSEVILKNTNNSKLEIDPNDENWYLNLKVTAENSWTVQPGQRVMKRAYQGSEAELYAYVLATIKYFNEHQGDKTNSNTYFEEVYIRDDKKQNNKKPWWKIW
jgi:hypothetical protein